MIAKIGFTLRKRFFRRNLLAHIVTDYTKLSDIKVEDDLYC